MADAIHFVDANGLQFAYLEEGSGPLVLMLHGFPDTAHTWDDLAPANRRQGIPAMRLVRAAAEHALHMPRRACGCPHLHGHALSQTGSMMSVGNAGRQAAGAECWANSVAVLAPISGSW